VFFLFLYLDFIPVGDPEMKIFSLIDKLKKEHSNHTVIRKNGTLLLNPGKSPKHNIYCISLLQAN
jgi:hypothetical protein